MNFKNRPVRIGDLKGGGPKQPPPLPLIGVARSLPLIGLMVLTRAAESESEPESESVGVGCFPRSLSLSRIRQNLPTPTDSGQALIPDLRKSPCRLIKTCPAQIYVLDWQDDIGTEPSSALLCIADMAFGRNSGSSRPIRAPMPEMWHLVWTWY